MKYILTFDYELFGSGKGDVLKHLVAPTDKMLETMQRLGIRATFFIEYLELEAIFKEADSGNPLFIDDAKHIKAQLERMVSLGHDLQLHLHPQWYQAQYRQGQWQLNFDWWRFSALPYRTSADGTPGQLDLLLAGKAFLEALIQPLNSEYRCHAFRAGGYNVGFNPQSVKALSAAGFDTESSLCPGFYANKALCQYDYTDCDSFLPHPMPGSDEPTQVIEYPLLTLRSSLPEKISLARLYTRLFNKKLKRIGYQRSVKPAAPLQPHKLTNSNFDVCLSSRAQVQRFLALAQQKCLSTTVLIGHAKDYSWFSPFAYTLKRAQRQGQFITLSDARETV